MQLCYCLEGGREREGGREGRGGREGGEGEEGEGGREGEGEREREGGGKGRNGYVDRFIISFTCCSAGNLLKFSFNFLISDTNLTIVSL